ncbi:glutamyl-tRNA reductase [Helicobacter cynogastricus]|uniref:Glutamyl-tRNA reductase n=1 Tax=Helicobacter cynogastricus TaxID=329937 RepID=A0A1R3UCT7_9HELI|nr:glutamyl-tRNA reductase [Helicobacter cynogastricus]SFZ72161.1 OMP1443 [Helicobacter cynogastricus]
MQVGYLTLGFSHKLLPIESREKLAFTQGALLEFLSQFKKEHASVYEIMALCTCNRVEFYLYAHEFERIAPHLLKSLSLAKGVEFKSLQASLETHTQEHAIHHVFCVVSSLDSLVVGETQITGQFKEAFKLCLQAGLCAKHLSRLAHFALKCAAGVRKATTISSQAVSIASVAVKQALEILNVEKLEKRAMVVGMGEMGQLVCKHLLAKGFEIELINRNIERAREFVQSLKNPHIQARPLSALEEGINAHSFLFSATSAPTCVITQKMARPCVFRRWWFDLAVPRDIEPPIEPNIWLYSVDDLQGVATQNLEQRQKDTRHAYQVVGQFSVQFAQWLQSLEVDPLIKDLRELAKQAALKELQRAIKKGYLPQEYEQNVARILHNAFNTFLHPPTATLKKSAHKPESDMLGESLKTLFNLGKESLFINRYKCEFSEEGF